MVISRPASMYGSNVPSHSSNSGPLHNRTTSIIALQSLQQSQTHSNMKAAPGTGSNSAQSTPHLGGLAQLSSATSSSHHSSSYFISHSNSASNANSSACNSTAAAAPSPSLVSTSSTGGGQQSGGPAFNTELRAQLRREREATREKSREKLNGHSNGQSVNNCVGNSNQQQSHSHHQQQQQNPVATGRDRSSSSVGSGVVPSNAQSNSSNERKISPKMNTKPHHPGHIPSSHSLQNLHSAAQQTQASNRHFVHHRVPGNQRNATGVHIEARSNSISHIDPHSMHSTPELGTTNEGISSLRGIQDLIARIPSPPGPNDDRSSQQVDETTRFVQQYYALLEKCQSWQRYATSMKARSDNLEIENRYLRDTNRKHQEDVRALELQLRGLKETAMMLEDERRRTEDRHERYTKPTLRHPSSQPIRRPGEVLSSTAHSIPSPPPLTDSHQYSDDRIHPHHFPSESSSDIRHSEGSLDQRPPTSLSILSMPSSLRNAVQHFDSRGDALTRFGNPSYDQFEQYEKMNNPSRNDVTRTHTSRHERNDSNMNEILAQDARNRDAAANMQEAYQSAQGPLLAPSARHGGLGLSESHSFPPSEVVNSKTLVIQSLASTKRDKKEATKMNRLPSSSSAPMLRPADPASGTEQQGPSPPKPVLRHQSSESSAVGMANQSKQSTKRNALHGNTDGLQGLGVRGLLKAPASGDGRLSTVPGSRCGSVQSDAMTVTEEYLQGVVEQKRQLRKISLSQQQQLHFLQARVHMDGANAALQDGSSSSDKENIIPSDLISAAMSGTGGRSSRPSSRMSNSGLRGKTRSRAGSHSLHDAIPIDKDDVFSNHEVEVKEKIEKVQRQTIRRTGSAPLGQVTLNGTRSGAMSALELRHTVEPSDSDASLDLEEERERMQGINNAHFAPTTAVSPISNEATPSGTRDAVPVTTIEESDNDPKGAHRRLYMRLRDELTTEELVKFERYVHRYDALDLEMDGAKGIINRVRRLLLSEEILDSKYTRRERYQFRKELAREFERIVREDAVPAESTSEFDPPLEQPNFVSV